MTLTSRTVSKHAVKAFIKRLCHIDGHGTSNNHSAFIFRAVQRRDAGPSDKLKNVPCDLHRGPGNQNAFHPERLGKPQIITTRTHCFPRCLQGFKEDDTAPIIGIIICNSLTLMTFLYLRRARGLVICLYAGIAAVGAEAHA
jgi:hypothetical protein